MSVRQVYGETRFSRPLIKIEVWFLLCRFLLYMSIYSTNIFSVGLSVRLQKVKELRYLMDVVIRVIFISIIPNNYFKENNETILPEKFVYLVTILFTSYCLKLVIHKSFRTNFVLNVCCFV